MPTARPITVMMFTAKTETSNQAPIATVSAMATRMATTARASGMMAAATVPKTSSRITIAKGTPISSPRRRSDSARSRASRAHVALPVTATEKPSRPSASRTRS